MPTYSYECDCGHNFEEFKLISKRNEATCPKCGNTNPTRLIGRGSGVIFKGDGFYESTKKEAEMYQPLEDTDAN